MSTKVKWQGSIAEVYDPAYQYTHVHRFAPAAFEDHFFGADAVIPASGSEESGCKWSKKIVGAAPPTVAKVADAGGGVVQCALTSDSQAQTAALEMGDMRNFDVSKGLIWEARVKVSVLPTLVAEAVWGLIGDYAAPDSVTYSAFFTADGSGEIFCEVDDNATDSSATSGVTATTAQWKVYRMDFTSVTDVKFYIDGSEVAAATTFPYAATGANAILQPWFGMYKASGAGLGIIQVDYVRIWQNW